MANHCVVLSDENPYLKRTLQNKENIMLYCLKDEKQVRDMAEELLTNHVLCKAIQENAYQEFCNNHTWEKRVLRLLSET